MAHQIFTYRTIDDSKWEKKIQNLVHPTFRGNENTRAGHDGEKKAIQILKTSEREVKNKTGLVINCNAPWLGFSPDAFMKIDGKLYLVEVKTLTKGKKMSGDQLLENLQYVERDLSTKLTLLY